MIKNKDDVISHILDDILCKANNNQDRQAYIRPSDFGFGNKSENTEEFVSLLRSEDFCSSVTIIGKDLVSVVLKMGGENDGSF